MAAKPSTGLAHSRGFMKTDHLPFISLASVISKPLLYMPYGKSLRCDIEQLSPNHPIKRVPNSLHLEDCYWWILHGIQFLFPPRRPFLPSPFHSSLGSLFSIIFWHSPKKWLTLEVTCDIRGLQFLLTLDATCHCSPAIEKYIPPTRWAPGKMSLVDQTGKNSSRI